MSSSAFTPTQTQITNNVPTNVPIVEAWQSYTPTFSNFGTVTNIAAWYRRVGDSIQIYARYVTGTTVASPVTISLPSGLNTDVSKSGSASRVIGRWYRQVTIASNRKTGCIIMRASSQNVVSFGSDDYSTAVGPLDEVNGTAIAGSGETHTCEFTVPIAEWAGSGTTTLATRAVEEYAAATSGTWDANATAAQTIYGPEGAPITGAISVGSRNKVVRFQSPILPTDKLFLEIYNLNGNPGWVSHTDVGFGIIQQLTQVYGAQINPVNAGFNTDCVVYFYQFSSPASNAYGGAGQQWSNGLRWRLRKVSGGAQVGYPVSARNIVGDTSGTVVPTGMIGETITASPASSVTWGSTGAYKTIATLNLTAGVWLLKGVVGLDASGGTWSFTDTSISPTTNALGIQESRQGYSSGAGSGQYQTGNIYVNISSNTPYYLTCRVDYSVNSSIGFNTNTILRAIRIG